MKTSNIASWAVLLLAVLTVSAIPAMASPVPEPSEMSLMVLGLAGAGVAWHFFRARIPNVVGPSARQHHAPSHRDALSPPVTTVKAMGHRAGTSPFPSRQRAQRGPVLKVGGFLGSDTPVMPGRECAVDLLGLDCRNRPWLQRPQVSVEKLDHGWAPERASGGGFKPPQRRSIKP